MDTRPYGLRRILGPGWRGADCIYAPGIMGKIKSFLGVIPNGSGAGSGGSGNDQYYISARNQYIQMFRGMVPGITTIADADAILDAWATLAQDAWSADWIPYSLFESDMDWASSLYDQALIRINKGGVPSGTTVDPYTGRWVTSSGTIPAAPPGSLVARPTSYTPWIIAGSVGFGILALLALRGRRRK